MQCDLIEVRNSTAKRFDISLDDKIIEFILLTMIRKLFFFGVFVRTPSDFIRKSKYIEGKASWLSFLESGLKNYKTTIHGTRK